MNMKKYQYFELFLILLIAAYFTLLSVFDLSKPLEAFFMEFFK